MAFNEDPTTISFSDSKLILTSVSKNKIGSDMVTDLVFGKWNIFAEKYSGDHFFARTLQKLFSDRNTQQFLNKVFTMHCRYRTLFPYKPAPRPTFLRHTQRSRIQNLSHF